MKKLFITLALGLAFTATVTSCREKKTNGEKIEDSLEQAGDDIEDGVEDAGDAIEDAVD